MSKFERYIIEPCRKIKGTEIYAHAIYDNITESFIEEYNKKGLTRQFLDREVKYLNLEFNDYDTTISQYCGIKTYQAMCQMSLEGINKSS